MKVEQKGREWREIFFYYSCCSEQRGFTPRLHVLKTHVMSRMAGTPAYWQPEDLHTKSVALSIKPIISFRNKFHVLIITLFFVGYLRVILNLSALYLMLRHPFVTVALHLTGNGILDVFDGAAARYFKQCKGRK